MSSFDRRQDNYSTGSNSQGERPASATAQYMAQKKLEERISILASNLEELTKLINMKTERLAVKMRMVEERQEEFIQDVQKRLLALNVRGAETAKLDLKIQELLERQNQMVRNFENRINQMKRALEK